MARTIRSVLPCFLLLVAAALFAQAPAQTGAAHITLGKSAVPLYGPWKFTVGDSPIDPRTGTQLWAEPDFDDSKWETVDLTPRTGAIDPIMGLQGYIPGWTANGHPGYFGYAWYRIRVLVHSHPGDVLALAGQADVDDAYQVFDNGVLAGHFGNFSSSKPEVYSHFQLKPEDKLMLMSDGIAEATDANGRLFGFERVHELLRTAATAAEIARAAQAFGQEDDISVIAVTRTMVLEPVAV
jgi:hypothetical protein